jgi:glycosyltransferase involved in cell wall biosynthesis
VNIAHVIPHSIGYPLLSHNGRYDWVNQLALRQVKEGHTVTVYGSPDSTITGVRCLGILHPTDDRKQNNIDTFHLAFTNDHDIYHSHFDNLHYEVASETKRPIIFTQHWWPTSETIEMARSYSPKNVWAVPPTQFMYDQDEAAGIQSKGYIYHGIDLAEFYASNTLKSDRLLFVGRISPEKNLDLAIKITILAHTKLDIIGKITPKNQDYWNTIEPLIDGDTIRYLGAKNKTELVDYYSSAKGVLFPSDPNEPFGLVTIEAQACGTPVIMKRGGSRAELIREGVTGFLCNTESDFISAIESLDRIVPARCIEFASAFNITTMVTQYDQLYELVTAT